MNNTEGLADESVRLPLTQQQPVTDRLQAWTEQMQADIALADAKASILLGWAGTALAVVSTVLVSMGGYVPAMDQWVTLVGLAGLAGLAWTVGALVLVIRPRLGGRPWGGYTYNTEDRSFLTFASVETSFVVDAARADTHMTADPALAARRVQLLAGIALSKHRLTRLACTVLLLSMPMLALAAAVMAAGMSA